MHSGYGKTMAADRQLQKPGAPPPRHNCDDAIRYVDLTANPKKLQLLGLQQKTKRWIQSRAGPGTDMKNIWVVQISKANFLFGVGMNGLECILGGHGEGLHVY